MRVVLLTFTAMIALASAAFGETIQALRNPGFEGGAALSPWRADTWSGEAAADTDADMALSGRRSLRLNGKSPDATAVASQTVGIPYCLRDTKVKLSGWWRGQGLNGTGGRVIARLLGRGGEKIRDEAPICVNGTFEWRPFACEIKLPDNATTVQLFLEIWESEGTVWYDDLSLEVDFPVMNPRAMRTGSGGPSPIRVAVYDADADGGEANGETGVLEALKGRDGIAATRITSLLLPVLFEYDVLIMPDVHSAGMTSLSDFGGHEIGIGTDWRANVRAFVSAGGAGGGVPEAARRRRVSGVHTPAGREHPELHHDDSRVSVRGMKAALAEAKPAAPIPHPA